MPVKGPPLVRKRLERHDIFRETVYLNIISVHHGNQIPQLIFSREHDRLPSIAFILLPVRHETVNKSVFIFSIHPISQSHTCSLGEAEAEWSGGSFNIR